MLRPEHISVGSLRDTVDLTLLLPRHEGEQVMLVVPAEGGLQAVFLDGPYAFSAFPCDTNDSWSGLMVPGVRVALDPAGLFDPGRGSTPAGALVRHADQLSIAVNVKDPRRFARQTLLPLLGNLAATAERESAGFLQWQVVLGSGDDSITIHTVALDRKGGR